MLEWVFGWGFLFLFLFCFTLCSVLSLFFSPSFAVVERNLKIIALLDAVYPSLS